MHIPVEVSCLYICWYSPRLPESLTQAMDYLLRLLKALVRVYWVRQVILEEAGWDVY